MHRSVKGEKLNESEVEDLETAEDQLWEYKNGVMRLTFILLDSTHLKLERRSPKHPKRVESFAKHLLSLRKSCTHVHLEIVD